MELRQLRYFVESAEAKSISTAAKNLYITQPTLTQNIKKLEEELGVELFIRNRSGVQLTDCGNLLYKESVEIIDRLKEIKTLLKQKKYETEKIRIGLTVLSAMQFMPQFSDFIAKHHDVELTFTQNGSVSLQNKLANGEIDLGILSYPKIVEDINIEPLETSTQGYSVSVVLTKDNPLSKKSTLTILDLKNEKFSSLTDEFVLGKQLPKWTYKEGFLPDVVHTNPNWEVLVTGLKTFNSVCLLPTAFEKLFFLPDTVWVPLNDAINYFPIGIALHKDYNPSPLVQELIESIKQN